MEPGDSSLKTFLDSNNLNHLIKSNTSFKGKSAYIDSILTSRKYSSTFTGSQKVINNHQNFEIIETLIIFYKGSFREALHDCSNSYDSDGIFTTKRNEHAPKRESGLGEIISPILMNHYARPLRNNGDLRIRLAKSLTLLLLKTIKNSVIC